MVRKDGLYDKTRRHGMPGVGYYGQEARSPNHANLPGHDQFLAWGNARHTDGFAINAEKSSLQSVVETHQDMVWAHDVWPASL